MKMTAFRLAPMLLLAGVLLAACGSGSTANAPASATPPNPPAAAQPTATEAPATAAPGEATAASAPQASGELTLALVPAESEARFSIDEVLAGSPNRVVGKTSDVQGEITVDPADPAGASLSPITIGAGSLATDNGFRNRAINSFILQTGEYPDITFTPTGLLGMPSSAAPGDTIQFQVVGDLTVRDITRQVTFDVTLTAESAARLSGTASATIQRADFDLNIPSVPQVADVSEQVLLELDFVAQAGS